MCTAQIKFEISIASVGHNIAVLVVLGSLM